MPKTAICSICFRKYEGFGNNAQPINDGRCCDGCNGLVILARLQRAWGAGGSEGGKAKTPAKARAARLNGLKGGKPKKAK